MKFFEIFKDDNSWNEKTIVGFIAFVLMAIAMLVNIVLGFLGKPFVINEAIYDSFLFIVLGAFGIAGLEKILAKKN